MFSLRAHFQLKKGWRYRRSGGLGETMLLIIQAHRLMRKTVHCRVGVRPAESYRDVRWAKNLQILVVCSRSLLVFSQKSLFQVQMKFFIWSDWIAKSQSGPRLWSWLVSHMPMAASRCGVSVIWSGGFTTFLTLDSHYPPNWTSPKKEVNL